MLATQQSSCVTDVTQYTVNQYCATQNSTIGMLVQWLASLVGLAYLIWNYGYRQGTTGSSLGKSVMKFKVVSEITGQPIGFGMSVVRQLAHIVDAIICFIGYLFPLWDAKRQTLADKIMTTVCPAQSGGLSVELSQGAARRGRPAAVARLIAMSENRKGATSSPGRPPKPFTPATAPDPATGAVNAPIYASSTFAQDGVGGLRGGFEYARTGNPTRAALEASLAAVEDGALRAGVQFRDGRRRLRPAGDAAARRPCGHPQ